MTNPPLPLILAAKFFLSILMGLETGIQDKTGSGPQRRRLDIGNGNGDGAQGECEQSGVLERTPEDVTRDRRSRVFDLIWDRVVTRPLGRLGVIKKAKRSEQKEVHPELMETRDEETSDPLEQVLPDLEKGLYTSEELHTGLEALIRVLEAKEDRMSQVNVVTTKPEHFERCVRILEAAKEKLAKYKLDDQQIIRMMPSVAGVLIGCWGEEGRDTRHLPLFDLQYDEELAGLRRGYLLADPVRLIDCFDEKDRPAVRENPLLKERERRLQEVIALLVQRLGQVIDRVVYDHQWGILAEKGVIQEEERVPIHPDIAAILADQVTDPEAVIPYVDGISEHVTDQKKRIRRWLTEDRPKHPRKNPLLEKLKKAQTPWQELLDGAYKMHTFGPSMLNVFNPESMILGVIEEFCIENKHLNAEQMRQALSKNTLRSLLVKKGMARMKSSGWTSKSGLLSQNTSSHAEAANLESSEKTLLDEYMTSLRLPRSGSAFGIAEMFMWKEMDFEDMTAQELESSMTTLPMRSQAGILEFGSADYLNLLRIRTIHALSREDGPLVTTWDQYIGLLMEDPAIAKLFFSPDGNTDLWEKNRDVIRQAFRRAYGGSKNKKEQAMGALMETALAAPADENLSDNNKKELLMGAQSIAKEFMRLRSRQQIADEQMIFSAWGKRFNIVNEESLLSYIEGPGSVTKLKASVQVLDAYLQQLMNTSTSMLRILLLWDERFYGGLGSAFSFTQDDPQIIRQLQMIEQKNGLIIPVQRNGAWVFVYPTKLPR